MPPEAANSFAFVVVQHLDPGRKSMLSELVGQYTRMPVREVTDGMVVKRGNVYVIPPNNDIALLTGQAAPDGAEQPARLRLPIDFFFRSLAQERRDRAVAVILSGTGTDGTLGLKAIKEAGGLVIVQQPDTAQYDGMPRSAIATGLADYVLPPGDMAARLYAYAQRVVGPALQGDAEQREAAVRGRSRCGRSSSCSALRPATISPATSRTRSSGASTAASPSTSSNPWKRTSTTSSRTPARSPSCSGSC